MTFEEWMKETAKLGWHHDRDTMLLKHILFELDSLISISPEVEHIYLRNKQEGKTLRMLEAFLKREDFLCFDEQMNFNDYVVMQCAIGRFGYLDQLSGQSMRLSAAPFDL